MIVLGKNKIDDRFNIDDNGVITDKSGNVITLENSPRPRFKGVKLHQVQMWTKKGWRDPEKWAIHHKDQNSLNNNINNLVYLKHSEHVSLHRSGTHQSEKTKKKISESMMYHFVSEETKKKISKKIKKYWMMKKLKCQLGL